MENSLFFRNESSKGRLTAGLFIPFLPIVVYLIVVYYLELDVLFTLALIPYILIWIAGFQFMLSNVFEVMIIYPDRIYFINPYRTNTISLNSVNSINYHTNHGMIFHRVDGKVMKPGFKFEMDNHSLENVFQTISIFINFAEEHIKDSRTYCLVNRSIRGASQRQ